MAISHQKAKRLTSIIPQWDQNTLLWQLSQTEAASMNSRFRMGSEAYEMVEGCAKKLDQHSSAARRIIVPRVRSGRRGKA